MKLVSLLLFCWSTSYAVAWADTPLLAIKGFGSAGVVRADTPSYFLSEFGTYGRQPNYTQNSRIGLNLSSTLHTNWTMSAQFIAERGYDGYGSYLDWGFVSYQPIPEFAIRAGRIIAGTWLFSQQLKVGYSYLWVRPPVEVYSLLQGFTNLNGVSLLSRLPLGGGTLSAEIYGGAENDKTFVNNPASPTVSNTRIEDLVGVDLSYAFADVLTLHASYLQSHTAVTVMNQTVGVAPFYTSTTTVVPLDTHLGRFFSLGGMMDYKNFVLIGEFARRLLKGQALQSASGWYGTLGYRISKFTPHFTYAWQGSLRGSYNLHPTYPAVTSLKKGQHSFTLGGVYQANDSITVKAEWQPARYKYQDATRNFKTNVLSASVNFIF